MVEGIGASAESPRRVSTDAARERKEVHVRVIAIAVSVLVLVAGTAGANPIVGEWLYIDFDPPNFVHRADPPIYTAVDAYLMLDLTYSGEPGFTAVSFRLDVTPGVSSPPVFTNLLPGDVAIGDWETGITLASTECITSFPAQIAVLSLYYLGTPGDVAIYDHPEYPRWVVDCQDPGMDFYYCVYSFGGVGKDPDVGPFGDCGGSPVEDISWTAIKSLYR